MKPLFEILCFLGIGYLLLMSLTWAVSMRLNFLSLVDAVWAVGISFGVTICALVFAQNQSRSVFASALVVFWGLRLGLHLATRLKRHFPLEDTRYQELRISWKDGFFWKTYIFFVFQATTQTLFAFPFIAVALDPAAFPRPAEIVGGVISLLGIAGEFLADSQLKKFKSDPAHQGQVCNVGLWRYSRHPNYFFEWIIWCGFAILALQAPYGLFALLCPIVMLFLLLFVTGVRPSEEQSLKTRGDLYREYQKTTSAFFLWFPKRNAKEMRLHVD